MRTITVITTSRADYSHLYWPLKRLAAHRDIALKLVVLGAHLSPEFGLTIEEIEKDGFTIDGRLECLLSSDSDVGMAKTIGLATLSLADLLGSMRPDLMLLIADRYEMLAPASVALALRIPLAHIEGGEVSQGAIDDMVRNALTKLSHVHFTSTEMARKRVIAMGEEEWRVHRAGAPSLDHLRETPLLSKAKLEAQLGISLDRPTILVAFHPVTVFRDTNEEAIALYTALAKAPEQIIFCYPNSDAGGRDLIAQTKEFLAARGHGYLKTNLDAVTYWSLMARMQMFVGNSSSGIMETGSFALPTVNIGLRQQGRERARNCIDVSADAEQIIAGMERARSAEFRASLAGMENPYGSGQASERIVEVLANVPLGQSLLMKKTVELP